MLQHLPRWLGQALANVRAGADRVAVASLRHGEIEQIALSSPAFAEGERMPARFTADGEGVSPPLRWGTLPDGTAALALLVEDADAPAPNPLVHAVMWDLDPASNALEEGAIGARGDGKPGGATPETGRNSFFRRGWLPPDPPPGHGSHRYAFQLFALGPGEPFDGTPGRDEVMDAVRERGLASGCLIGTYARPDGSIRAPDALPLAA